EFLDGSLELYNVAVNDAEGFTVFTLFGKTGMKDRKSRFLTQLGDAQLVEASHRAASHLRCPFEIHDELLIRNTEFEDVVPAVVFRSKRQRQTALRKEYGAATFNNERVAYACGVPPKFDFRSSLVRNENKRNLFFSNAVDYGCCSLPRGRHGVD